MTKTVKIIFTMSLVLNVLLLGGGIGALVHHPERAGEWKKVKESLSPETRDLMKATFKKSKGEVFPLFKEVRKKKQEMKNVIMAEEFDPDVYDELATELKSIKGPLLDHKLEIIKGVLSQLPQDERVKLADHTVDKLFGKSFHKGRKNRRGSFDRAIKQEGNDKGTGNGGSGRIEDAANR